MLTVLRRANSYEKLNQKQIQNNAGKTQRTDDDYKIKKKVNKHKVYVFGRDIQHLSTYT